MAYVRAGRYSDPLLARSGAPIRNRSVTVYLRGTDTLAGLYTDRTKVVPVLNPTSSDNDGNLTIFADPGEYDIEVGGVAARLPITVPIDPDEAAQDSDLGGLQQFTYEHDQMIPSSLWTVVHNLGGHPAVTVVDTASTMVEGEIAYPDSNIVTIAFNSAFAGKAYLS